MAGPCLWLRQGPFFMPPAGIFYGQRNRGLPKAVRVRIQFGKEMSDLFAEQPTPVPDAHRPLADRLRPTRLGDVIGQQGVLGPDAPLTVMLTSGALSSLVFWGPLDPVQLKPPFLVFEGTY